MFDHYYKGVVYSRPEFLYSWGYYFTMNFVWIIIPALLLKSSIKQIANAFGTVGSISAKANKGKKGQEAPVGESSATPSERSVGELCAI
ncbi:hypothetical protein ACLOAV_010347 [Pseudogymnoascus australis]